MNYWWVNHKQTFQQEVSGGYIWSPKRKADGARNHFYDTMTEVRPGDIVFSYADQAIRAIGIATAAAITAPKPTEFEEAGANWSQEGWWVPVQFERLAQPLRPKDHLDQIVSLLPEKYSPLRANGDGNQGAYLAGISKELAAELQDLAKTRPLVSRFDATLSIRETEEADERAEGHLRQRTDIPETQKAQLILARRGQGLFRTRVEAIESGCRVTGIKLKEHLRASHIKPWRNATDAERLDGDNGLLLAPHVDHLFDKGFLSFDDQGRILVSPRLDPVVLLAWNIETNAPVGRFSPEQSSYLGYHRTYVFQHEEGPNAR